MGNSVCPQNLINFPDILLRNKEYKMNNEDCVMTENKMTVKEAKEVRKDARKILLENVAKRRELQKENNILMNEIKRLSKYIADNKGE